MGRIAIHGPLADACCATCPRTNGYLTEVIPAEASPVLDGGQPADRAALHRWARDQSRDARKAVRRYNRAERRYRKAVMKARAPQQRERVQQRLAAMPVEALARGSRVNTAALRRVGVTTAADVEQRTVEALERIHDIGPKSARKIKDLVAEFAQIRPDDLRPPGNPDTWKAADYALVRALATLALVTALAPHAAVLQQVLGATRWLISLRDPCGQSYLPLAIRKCTGIVGYRVLCSVSWSDQGCRSFPLGAVRGRRRDGCRRDWRTG